MPRLYNPEVWSDLDGTGVALVKKYHPRNWTKYPLRVIPGYTDFLGGLQQGGVDIAGIVSRRPAARRWVTTRSIAKLGLEEFFPDTHRIVLAGSETGKASRIATRSYDRSVGVIDDKPHRIGKELLDVLSHDMVGFDAEGDKRQVVLGAVDHEKSAEYFERLFEYIEVRSDVHCLANDSEIHATGLTFDLHVFQVAPYSTESGLAFARSMISETSS